MGTGAWILLIAVLTIAFWAIAIYNGFVRMNAGIENSYKQIDVQLKRRYDLIPNLVESVKGYMKFEKETLESVINARSKAMTSPPGTDKFAAEGALSGALSKLFAVAENYPDLKSNTEVQTLMEELRTTENQLAFSRQYYNDSVMRFNTKTMQFPANIIAGMFNFKPKTYFHVEEAAKITPKVDLNIGA
ncbi:MAG: LemA family protein [Deltaproteobacteria bacterium]|nr:LemA family protein [Deltaproteobacteria bacterium]MCL5791672.1 LemA family protein [Deltaproteobacteria bacterium]